MRTYFRDVSAVSQLELEVDLCAAYLMSSTFYTSISVVRTQVRLCGGELTDALFCTAIREDLSIPCVFSTCRRTIGAPTGPLERPALIHPIEITSDIQI